MKNVRIDLSQHTCRIQNVIFTDVFCDCTCEKIRIRV